MVKRLTTIESLRELMLNANVQLDGYRVASGKHSMGREMHRGHGVRRLVSQVVEAPEQRVRHPFWPRFWPDRTKV